jgi:hypothetical protein
MAKARLGELLVRAGLITESDLRVALAQQKQHGGRLGEHLVRVNLLTEETLARMLAQQLGLQYADVKQVPPPGVTQLLAERVAVRLQMLPIALDARSGLLTVAASDPLDDAGLAEVVKATGKQVQAQVAQAGLLRRAIERAYFGVDVDDDSPSEFQLVDIHGRGKTVRVHDDHQLQPPLAERPPPVSGAPPPAPTPAEPARPVTIPPLNGPIRPVTIPPLNGPIRPVTIPPLNEPVRPVTIPPLGKPSPMRIAPLPPGALPTPSLEPATRPAGQRPGPRRSAADESAAGEEALRLCWALADLLIERGYFTRAELMRALRGK